MPKQNIDYSNTVIYKIYCRDSSVKDVYVGHTTNLEYRKYSHKIACNNFNNKLKIYEVIRSNGGWDNWDMVEIAKYCCKNLTEARIKENLHYEELQSSLNSIPPHVDRTKYYCFSCKLQCSSPKTFNKHINSNKHKKNLDNQESKNKSEKFKCQKCNYSTCRKSQYIRHLSTNKHKNTNIKLYDRELEQTNSDKFQCNCGIFFSRTGLWRHKKVCKFEKEELVNKNTNNNSLNTITPEYILQLIKNNNDMTQIIIEQNIIINNLAKLFQPENTT